MSKTTAWVCEGRVFACCLACKRPVRCAEQGVCSQGLSREERELDSRLREDWPAEDVEA